MKAIVMLADLKASRKKEDRDAVGRRIRESLRKVSEQFEDDLVTEFDIQRGIDEFGGIVKETAPSGELLLELWKELHPHAVRISLAEGTLDVVPDADSPSIHEFDGPAFHVASEALDSMDKEGKLVSMRLEGQPPDSDLEDVANLIYFHILDWTPRQLEIYEAYTEMNSQSEVAERFGISQPTVSETLQNVRTKFMQKASDRMAGRINETFGGPA